MGAGMGMGQGASGIDQAANLMQYYESPSTNPYGGGGVSDLRSPYAANEFGGGSYTSSTGSSYALPAQQQYDFSTSYSGGGINTPNTGSSASTGGSGMSAGSMNAGGMSSVPRGENQGLRYQPMMNYQGDDKRQGRSDNPLIVE